MVIEVVIRCGLQITAAQRSPNPTLVISRSGTPKSVGCESSGAAEQTGLRLLSSRNRVSAHCIHLAEYVNALCISTPYELEADKYASC